MRFVSDIPHSRFKIQLFHFNSKYIVKVELAQFEQVFKIGESDVNGVEDVVKMVNSDFLRGCLDRFISMRTDWGNSFKEVTN